MAHDRSVRPLTALETASTSRVLNLWQIWRVSKKDREYAEKPLFYSPIFNTAFILKLRMGASEAFQFNSIRAMVTKVISPVDTNDLSAGGRSIMVDQRGFLDAAKMLGNYYNGTMEHDLQVLRLLDALPSFDPFLLRQHLINNKIDVAPCYFQISQTDQQGMHKFVTRELFRLTKLLGSDVTAGSTSKIVSAMLSSDVAEELAPLRETLNLSGGDFRQGVFSWRGYLYYKWSIENFWPGVMKVLKHLNEIIPTGAVAPEQKTFFSATRRRIIEMVRDNSRHVNEGLAIYDASFGDLVEHQTPKTFRDFLLSAPYMFVELGEKLGALSHMVEFWNQRFPEGKPAVISAEELVIILQDFASGFGDRIKLAKSLIETPSVLDKTASRA